MRSKCVGIGLMEVTAPSDTLIYKPFLFYKLLRIFLLFVFVWNKIFRSKTLAVFYIFFIWFE